MSLGMVFIDGFAIADETGIVFVQNMRLEGSKSSVDSLGNNRNER
jgi:hypothetical protein